MYKKSKYSLSPKGKTYFNYCIYGVFVIYVLYLAFNSNTSYIRAFYLLFASIISTFVFLHEYLNILYKKAIEKLTIECDPIVGLEISSKIERLDIFKSYKKSLLVFKLLAYSDLNRYEDILELLNKATIKPFSSSYDLLLIYYYSLFLSYISLDDRKNVKEYYKKCIELQNKGSGKNKIAPILSWNEIKAIYYIYQQDYILAKKYLRKVNISQLNNREKYLHLMNLSLLEVYDNNFNGAKIYLEEIIIGANKMQIKEKAKLIFKIQPKRLEDINERLV
ncbi:hypothetical protein JCM1393_07400 [Clostridium carnis]